MPCPPPTTAEVPPCPTTPDPTARLDPPGIQNRIPPALHRGQSEALFAARRLHEPPPRVRDCTSKTSFTRTPRSATAPTTNGRPSSTCVPRDSWIPVAPPPPAVLSTPSGSRHSPSSSGAPRCSSRTCFSSSMSARSPWKCSNDSGIACRAPRISRGCFCWWTRGNVGSSYRPTNDPRQTTPLPRNEWWRSRSGSTRRN